MCPILLTQQSIFLNQIFVQPSTFCGLCLRLCSTSNVMLLLLVLKEALLLECGPLPSINLHVLQILHPYKKFWWLSWYLTDYYVINTIMESQNSNLKWKKIANNKFSHDSFGVGHQFITRAHTCNCCKPDFISSHIWVRQYSQ
jgi:hypothetical protein